jgi:hypothetical protein
MGEIVSFRRPGAKQRHRGNMLCRRGFHNWKTLTTNRFDVKQGRLVTVYECIRCGLRRNEAT